MKILVSACLLGEKTRYDGKDSYHIAIEEYCKGHEVVKVCPEILGGLAMNSRIPCEIRDGRAIDAQGNDQSEAFHKGAQIVKGIVEKQNITLAIMKSKSPSCGFGKIYDGTFSGRLIAGNGFCVKTISTLGVKIMNSDVIINEYNKKKL